MGIFGVSDEIASCKSTKYFIVPNFRVRAGGSPRLPKKASENLADFWVPVWRNVENHHSSPMRPALDLLTWQITIHGFGLFFFSFYHVLL